MSQLWEQPQLHNPNGIDEKSMQQVMFDGVKMCFMVYMLWGNYILLSNNMQLDDVVNII